jgi:glycosyltransferase involved in cell wall biosynthesis
LILNLAKLDRKNKYWLYSREALLKPLDRLPPNFISKVLYWPPKRLWTQIRLSSHLLWEKPDLLFVPAHTLPLVLPPLVLTTIHDLGFKRYPELYGSFELRYQKWGLTWAVKKATKIITVSHFTKQELLAFYPQIDSQRIIVIYHGYSPEYDSRHPQSEIKKVLARYNLTQPYLLFVGRVEKKKNIIRLLQAFYQLIKEGRQEKLVLVGRPGLGFSQIELFIREHRLEDQVKILGYVTASDLPYLYQGCEVFVFPSLYEGFGIPLLEAFASGKPVICSDIAPLREIGQKAVLYFDPYSILDIAQKIKYLLDNPSLKEQLIQKGLERVKNFSWSQCALETLKIINSF